MRRFSLISGLLVGILALLVSSSGAAHAAPVPKTDYELMVRGVELRLGVTVDIRVRVMVNEERPCQGRTHFAIHGGLHAGSVWTALAETLFAGSPTGPPVCRIAVMDMPGRGGSSLPVGMDLGDMLLDDQVTALIETIRALSSHGIQIRTVLAQSQGALLVQMAQQRLIEEGSSLRSSFGIRKAIFLAPAAPAAVPWFIADTDLGALLVSIFTLTNPPPVGDLVAFDDGTWIGFNFSTRCCNTVVPSAPSLSEVALAGYNAPEPLDATLQILGLSPFARPWVDEDVFEQSRGTMLAVVGYSEDSTVLYEETAMTYLHLTGDESLAGFVLVEHPEAVHAMHISDPISLLAATASKIRF